MSESISRRNFFSRIGSAAFRGLGDPEPENPPPARENPFPGQLYWDARTQDWRPAYGINSEGYRLSSYDHPDSILTVLEKPPQISSFWNFRLGQWVLPLGGRDVQSRTIRGSQLSRELYSYRSQTPQAQLLRQEASEKWPQVDVSEAFLIGKTKSALGFEDEYLTVFFRCELKDPVLLEQFAVRDFIKKIRFDIYSLKISLASEQRLLRFYIDDSQGEKVSQIPMPSQFRGGSRTVNFLPGGEISSLETYNFYASNEDMREYCASLGFPYPENIFEMKRNVQIFGVAYDRKIRKILEVKRYYKWWLP